MKTLMTCLVALALLAPVATRAPATTVLATSFPALVQEADLVVVGTAQAIQQEWDEATETPYTLVTFTDLDLLKGRHRHPALTIRLLGGASPDGTSLQIAGGPFLCPRRAVDPVRHWPPPLCHSVRGSVAGRIPGGAGPRQRDGNRVHARHAAPDQPAGRCWRAGARRPVCADLTSGDRLTHDLGGLCGGCRKGGSP